MHISIIGNGKMGKAVAALAAQRGHTIQTVVAGPENRAGRALTAERLSGTDVALEFTRPDAVLPNLERLIDLHIPTVTGNTGWTEQLPAIELLVQRRGGALLYAANFSVGVHLFLRVARALAQCFRGWPDFTEAIHEEHHASKVDAPSGTALLLQQQLREIEPRRRFPITSTRTGETPGTHTISYETPQETVTLGHISRGRDVFAAGALAAAEWLPGHRGVFTFDDLLFEAEH